MPEHHAQPSSIRTTAARLRSGDLTARQLMEQSLAIQDRLADRLNVFASRADRQTLLDTAEAADALIRRGDAPSPLAGIPLAIKDIYDTTDLPTTASSRLLRDHRTGRDAHTVARLRSAGAIIVGKAHTHEFAYGPTTVNEYAGPSRNPWDLDRVPGGSSGGSAIAVAAGMCLGATGSDTGGSIRTPSALCGITGLKPTYGLVSRAGILPLSWSLDHAGPMARSADDVAILLHAMAGHDRADPGSAAVPIPDYPAAISQVPARLRLGVPGEHYFDVVSEEVMAAFSAALDEARALGWSVEHVSLPNLRYALGAELAIISSEASAWHRKRMGRSAELYSGNVRRELDAGMMVMATDYLLGQRARRLIGREFREALATVDLIVTPTVPITAPRITDSTVEIQGRTFSVLDAIWRNLYPTNLTGLPSISVPCGLSAQRLPIGLQLIGPAFQELLVLQAAHAYQSVTDWHNQRPDIVAS
jgi:aspartyl-tRNA(Asn)/glutamyl-tRNA(Gln) amidotransferase subunit A